MLRSPGAPQLGGRLRDHARLATAIAAVALAACEGVGDRATETHRPAPGRVVQSAPVLHIREVMADPRAVGDADGEWIIVRNAGRDTLDLRGWVLASGRDPSHRIARSVRVAPGAVAVLARVADPRRNGGVAAAYEYGSGIELANRDDWVALRAADGRTADSVAWTRGPAGSLAAAAASAAGRLERRVSYGDHLALGVPVDGDAGDDLVIRRPQYVLSYNARRGGPNWVSWHLERSHFGDAPRSPQFLADTALPRGVYPVVASDYAGSAYSRGHMVRSEERTASAADNEATFLMTNVLPQTRDLNAGPWADLERHVEGLARAGRSLWIVAGGVYDPGAARLRGRVDVPRATWKVVVVPRRGLRPAEVRAPGDVEVIAAIMPNVMGIARRRWQEYRTTVDAIEAATGYDLLSALAAPVEAAVEAR
ncbi:MAG TPA: DNA/RNA non-specific endonuclease [Gemmatimonadaceae bacterium]|nr:DNA/RNA non-specific endonuclease [Gemmatimonadaceae bacterium]